MSQQAIPYIDQTRVLPYAPRRPAAKSFVGHAKLIGGLTLVSRVMGLAREIVAGHYLGTGVVASAFTVAFTIPNLFRKLFGEGALAAAFIPLYAQAVKRERLQEQEAFLEEDGRDKNVPAAEWTDRNVYPTGGENKREGTGMSLPRVGQTHSTGSGQAGMSAPPTESANAFAAASVNLLCIILVALTIVGELIIGAMVLLDPNMLPDRLLTLKFTAIMLPYVLLICGTAFLGAILQVHKRFGAPAAAPIILNVCHVAVVLIGARFLHLHGHSHTLQTEKLQTTLAYWLSFFVLVAGVLQGAILLPALRAVGFRFQPVLHFWTPAIRKMLRLTLPVAIGAGVLQLSVMIDKGLSLVLMQGTNDAGQTLTHFSLLGHSIRFPMESGAPARLNLAQFLYQFPLGIFAIALATAIFPNLSAVAMEKDRTRFKSVLRQGIEATLFEGLPASIGLILVREPAVRLLFQHGQIGPHSADLIAKSTLFFSAAIWAFSLQQILNRAYYALHDTVTPLVMSLVTLALNLLVELPLVWTNLGEAGMAAGTLVSFSLQAIVMLYLLDRRVGGLGLRASAGTILKMILATAIMTVACIAIQHVPGYPQGQTRLVWAAQMAIIMGVGASVYFGACVAMGVGVVAQLMPKRRTKAPVSEPLS